MPVTDEKYVMYPLMEKEGTSVDLDTVPKDITDDPVTDKKVKRRTICVLVGSVAFNAFLVLLISITVHYMNSERRETKRESTLCLNCSHLKLHPDDDLSMYDIYEGVCCVKNGGNYFSMADKLVKRKWKEELVSASKPYHSLQCQHKALAVIKLVGKPKLEPDAGLSERSHWLTWDLNIQTTGENSDEQMTYDDTHITVHKTGIYQIYTQVSLQNKQPEEPSTHATIADKFYVHAVYKQSGSGHDERILGGSYTYYRNQNGESKITNYISSPYQLVKGDRIGVKVHDISQVVPSSVTNFFGMHLIQ